MADFLGIRVADFTALKTKWLEIVRLYDVHPEMAEAGGHRASITLPLVDETMTVNKNSERTRSSRGNVIDARRHLSSTEFAKQEIPSEYYTY
jgi:hypothetical protein